MGTERLKRINELAHKEKTEGLTEAERQSRRNFVGNTLRRSRKTLSHSLTTPISLTSRGISARSAAKTAQ